MFGLIKKVDDSYQVDVDNKTYTTLGYADGPGGLNGTRPDLRNVNTADKDFLQQATVLLDYESHGSEDIGESLVAIVKKDEVMAWMTYQLTDSLLVNYRDLIYDLSSLSKYAHAH